MRRAGIVLVLTTLLLFGCTTEERPEGVVDRWLNSLNQGAAGEPDRYASRDASEAVLPGWETCAPGVLDVIEVGMGREATDFTTESFSYQVPFRAEYAPNVEDLCPTWNGGSPGLRASALLAETDGAWQVIALVEGSALPLPSEGGDRVASASAVAWAISLATAAALCLLVMLLMVTVGKHETLVEEVAGEDIGHLHGGPG